MPRQHRRIAGKRRSRRAHGPGRGRRRSGRRLRSAQGEIRHHLRLGLRRDGRRRACPSARDWRAGPARPPRARRPQLPRLHQLRRRPSHRLHVVPAGEAPRSGRRARRRGDRAERRDGRPCHRRARGTERPGLVPHHRWERGRHRPRRIHRASRPRPATGIILAYGERIRRPDDFLAAVATARAHGKPVVLFHPGRSVRAQAAARSHTGALAGDHAAMRTAVQRAGVGSSKRSRR